jgi:hypothetical protein
VLTASVFAGPGLAAVAVIAVLTYLLARRRWALAVTLVVAADILTWSWLSWLKSVGNVLYWGSAAGIAGSLLALALSSREARRALSAVVAITLVLAATSAWSLSRHATLREAMTFGSVLVVAAFVGANLRRGSREGEVLVRSLAPIVPVVLLATLLVIIGEHSAAVAQGGGVSGLVNGPDALGIILALALPFLMVDRLLARSVVRVGVLVVVAFVVTLSGSRTGFVATAIVVGVVELGQRRWLRLGLGLAAVVAGAGLAVIWTPSIPTLGRPIAPVTTQAPSLAPSVPPQAKQLLGGSRPAGQSRFSSYVGARDEAWREAVRLIAKRPVVGNGFGTGSLLFDHYGSQSHFRYFVGKFASGVNPHNAYLQELLELGVFGGAMFLLSILLSLGVVLTRLRTGFGSEAEAALAALVVAAAFASMFESVLAGFGVMTMLTWIGVVGAVAMAMARRAPVRAAVRLEGAATTLTP